MHTGSDNEPAHSDQASANKDPELSTAPPQQCGTLQRAIGFKPKHLHLQKGKLVGPEQDYLGSPTPFPPSSTCTVLLLEITTT